MTDVIICGGDGTINQVASHLKNISVNTGIIPLGSKWTGTGCRHHRAPKALRIILAGKSAPLDAMINHRFSCMLCGLGFDAQVAHDFAKQPTRGLTTYIKQTVKKFFSSKSYPSVLKPMAAAWKPKPFLSA
ncbi:MAG: diacylglycerol kinase family protein [Ferruginibacter sp.]